MFRLKLDWRIVEKCHSLGILETTNYQIVIDVLLSIKHTLLITYIAEL
jgi:hypothetical protein